MQKIQFSGRIFPIANSFTLHNTYSVHFTDAEMIALGVDCWGRLNIRDNLVTIDCELNVFEKSKHLMPVTMRAYDIARATIDLMSFSSGNALMFILETLIDADGNTTLVVPMQPDLGKLATALVGPGQFDELLKIVLSDPPLFLALRDLVEGITFFHRAPINCARAIDCLRQYFVAPGASKASGWRQLQENLNVSEAYLKTITDLSRGPRHGDHEHIPGPSLVDATTKSWVIMNRYLEYRKRRSGRLPLADFPLLTV